MSSEPPSAMAAPLLLTAQDAAAASPESNLLVSILLLVVLIFLNGFFAASEIAVITLNDNKIRKMAEDGDKRAKKVVKLTENSSRFLSTIQIGVTLSGFLSSASASQIFAEMLADQLSFLPFSHATTVGVASVIITIILSYFSLVLGELVPKKIAIQHAEALSFRFAGVLLGIATVLRPVISLLSLSTNAVLKLLGQDPNSSEETVTEEEILMMVDAGEEKGLIGGGAKDMIENIFDFTDTTVGEIMTHRTEVSAVEDTDAIGDVVKLSIEKGYSRIPVYHEDIDTILGVIFVKDLLKYVGKEFSSEVKLTDLLRPAYFVPESKLCSQLFQEMTSQHFQFAVIVDEYGGTEGIVTLEDILESIVGNIQDEYDNEEEEIYKVSDNAYTVDGSTNIDEVSDLVGVDLPEGDYDTIAGLVVEHLGRIPKEGEHPAVTIENLTLTVEKVEDRRIAKILIVKEVPPAEPEDEEPDKEKEKEKGRKKEKNA